MTENPTEKVLLPCPFCGGEASDAGHARYSRPLDDAWWADGSPITEAFFVNCMKCGAVSRSGVSNGYQTKAEAIAAWNRRPPAGDGEAVAWMYEKTFAATGFKRVVNLTRDNFAVGKGWTETPLGRINPPATPNSGAEDGVTQGDRDAAADAVKAYRDQKNNNWQDRIRRGECDDGEMVQAFRRHRLTSANTASYQQRVDEWLRAAFHDRPEVVADKKERNRRFAEEACELLHECGFEKAHMIASVEWVFSQERKDSPRIEIGDVSNTLAALATAHGVDMNEAREETMVRCWANIAKMRSKWANKPTFEGANTASEREKALNCSQGDRYKDLTRARQANESFAYGWLRTRVAA